MDRATKISMEIEGYVASHQDVTYLEAITMYSEEFDIELEDMHKFITDSLKSKLWNEYKKHGNDSVSLEEYVL